MRTIKLSLFAIGAMILTSSLFAQSTADWCGTAQKSEEMKLKNPALIQQEENLYEQIRTYIDSNPQSNNGTETAPYIIPVVFHCITDNGAGWISKADIDDAILTLNEDFTRTNADAISTRALFAPVAGGTSIQFRLAHKDPSGNCTQGIVRLDSPLSTNAGDAVKALSRWDYHDYFNIWVVNSIDNGGQPGTILGYAYKPNFGLSNVYGVIVDNDYVGRTDRTLTHEIGHSFGLDHTFDNGCGGSCSTTGDRVCDTPPSSAATYGCDINQNTCSNDASGPDPFGADVVDQIENYMSYDACTNMFSLEQVSIMEFFLNSSSTTTGLGQLTNSSNWNLTGVNDPYNPANCAPIADFLYDKEYICAGGSVSFSDDSYNGTPNAWNWTFTGGSPSTSPLPSPTITYNTPGVFSVSYQPSSTGGTGNLVTKTSIITVSSLTADYVGPIIDGFEAGATQFNNDWTVINHEGSGFTWERSSTSAYTGSFSARIRNMYNSGTDIHDLISPSYDISTATSKTMKFKQAFAKKTGANTDRLLIKYSLDCGENWTITLPLLTSASIATVPNQTAEFQTTSTTQWLERVVDLTPIGTATNVRFKFEFTEGGGNNLFIDDINIGDFGVGINDFSNIASFSVYPNPTKSSAQISFNLTENVNNLSIKVRNSVGQEVTTVIAGQSFNSGKYTLKIDEQRKLSSGIYFIEFNADDNVKVQKLIVQ